MCVNDLRYAYITVHSAYQHSRVFENEMHSIAAHKQNNVRFEKAGQFVLGSALYVNVDLECNISILIYMFTFEILYKNLSSNHNGL